MQLPTQTKILRAIQEGEIQRVGATKVKKVDVRLLAATHKNLEAMVEDKSFREDLYYRLNVVRIKTPALQERMEDLPELVDFMLQRLNQEKSTGTAEISKEAMEILGRYSWPGNVRELENVLHSASVISKGKGFLVKTFLQRSFLKLINHLMRSHPSSNSEKKVDSNSEIKEKYRSK